MKDKAYKLLALQEGISNREAKTLIDKGLVSVGGKKVVIARADMNAITRFSVKQLEKPTLIYEDENIIALDKPAFLDSEEVLKHFSDARLLHRLDRETSGVLLLVKNEPFRQEAIKEFKEQRVYKEYSAWVEGIVAEELTVEAPIETLKRGNKAFSKVSYTEGKDAVSHISPEEVFGKRSKVKVVIETGRTHQIRVHLSTLEHPVLGDVQYGARPYKRMMLHARKISLLGMTFEAPESDDFQLNR